MSATHEGMIEARLLPNVSVSAFFGRGTVDFEEPDTTAARIRYGAQALWYPVGLRDGPRVQPGFLGNLNLGWSF
jgi:hypothetical protein